MEVPADGQIKNIILTKFQPTHLNNEGLLMPAQYKEND